MTALGAGLAQPLDKGEGDVPVLVKHLPDWQTAQQSAIYAVNIGAVTQSIPNQPILNEISFEGEAEAVLAQYGSSRLVIVEFNTPQLSGDNDQAQPLMETAVVQDSLQLSEILQSVTRHPVREPRDHAAARTGRGRRLCSHDRPLPELSSRFPRASS